MGASASAALGSWLAPDGPAERDRGPQLPHGPAWSTWMSCGAQRLWQLRAAFAAQHAATGCTLVPTTERGQSRAPGAPRQMLMVTRADAFVAIEKAIGLELRKAEGKGHLCHALTGVNGEVWRAQRTLLTGQVFPVGLGDGRPLRLAEEEASRALANLQTFFDPAQLQSIHQLELKADLLEPLCARWCVLLLSQWLLPTVCSHCPL
jgi:hypothetical protein